MSDAPMVERLARAICEANSGPFDFLSEDGKEACRHEARAVLQELREPDGSMVRAAAATANGYDREAYQAMINAALEGR